ncbi:MAG: TrkA family potassium uptake protein [Lachnospiraceae bacterium]|nr:TrkA family potassium uptake protein [Lachnospiraceae bacterium]
MSKSIAVLGLGKYGRSLAASLYSMGADVMVVDRNRELIREFADKSTVAIVADLANEEEIKELGIKNMDVVVVAMGAALGPSIMSVVVAKEQGVPLVVAKASSERMASILKKVGADKVINPEAETGVRSAKILTSSTFLDFFSVDENLCLIEMKPKKKWVGKSIKELELRNQCNINVVALKENSKSWMYVDPNRPLTADTKMLVALEKKDLKSIQ